MARPAAERFLKGHPDAKLGDKSLARRVAMTALALDGEADAAIELLGDELAAVRRIDPSAYLILWQIGVAGDRTLARFSATGAELRAVLLDLLQEQGYALSDEAIAYEAATLPIAAPRMERLRLGDLPQAELRLETTLVIPPARRMEPNLAVSRRLSGLGQSGW